MAILQDIQAYRGATVPLVFTMDPSIDAVGWSVQFTMRVNAQDSLIVASRTTITGGGNVVTFASLTHADTAGLLGRYAYDVQRIDSGSEQVIAIGTLTCSQEVLYP